MSRSIDVMERPSARLSVTEGLRANIEGLLSIAALPHLGGVARGDGQRVLVLPGFLADDDSTAVLRGRLTHLGYRADPWTMGVNIGPTDQILDGLIARLMALTEEASAPISLIGWSMGGAYACWLAHQHPSLVRSVITLAAPMRPIDPKITSVGGVFQSLKPMFSPRSKGPHGLASPAPLSMPLSAIYSRMDGVLPWRACLTAEGPMSENIAIHGSHTGMGNHIAALVAIGDRLAQRPETWSPFQPPAHLAWWFPTPDASST